MSHSRFHRFAGLLLLLAPTVVAQNNGTLTGTVLDPTGAAIPGAVVDLLLPDGKSAVLTTKTSGDGTFQIVAIKPGIYTVTVDLAGFTKTSVSNVSVDPGKVTSLPPLKLAVATSTQTVDVVEGLQAVDSTSFEVAQTITQGQVLSLPVLDRQIANLFTTQAGVSNNNVGSTVVNGMRSQYTNVTLDGINVQDNFIRLGGTGYLPNRLTIAQVAEMTISSANSPSNFGVGATQITLTTPSGGNQFHGSGYYYNRNSAVAATDWFSNQNGTGKQPLNLNQIGGTIGGPIVKDKLFFYGAYEAYRLRQTSLQNNTVLNSDARNGIFSYYVNGNGAKQSFNVLQARGLSVDPYISGLLKSLPQPNNNLNGDGLNTAGYQFAANKNETRDNVTVRGDYVLSPKNVFFASFSWNRDIQDRPDIPYFYTKASPVYNDNPAKFISAGWRSTPLPNLTNELRGGFNLTTGLFAVTYGVLPFYALNGYFDIPGQDQFAPQGRDTNTYSIQDNANYVAGKHNLSFGFQSQFIRVHSFDNNGDVNPAYTLGISPSNTIGLKSSEIPGITPTDLSGANALMATLNGIVSGYNQTFNVTSRNSGFVPGSPNSKHYLYDNYAGYVTDKYRLRRNLTLQAGLRYDYYPALTERDGLFLAPLLQNNNYVSTVLSNATLDFIGNGTSRPFYNASKTNFAPSVGLAWDVFGDGKTSVRGGYSLAYTNDDTIIAVQNPLTTNSGLQQAVGNSNVIGHITGDTPKIVSPTFQVPRTFLDNLKQNASNAEGIVNPALKVPYVQMWSFGLQHEYKQFIFEARYIGNHGVHELRGIDLNQVSVTGTQYLTDFKNAQSNLFLSQAAGQGNNPAYNPNIKGSVPLNFLPNLPNGGFLTNSTVRSSISSGQVGSLGQTYQTTYLPGINSGYSFFPSPYGLGMNAYTNAGYSNYNSAQFEVRRRLSNGQQIQVNYTFAKALSDTNGDLNNNRFEPYLDINNGRIEKAPSPYDLRHSFKMNYVAPIPLGKGHKMSGPSYLNRVIGGWTFSGFLTYQTGSPYSIVSRRGTLNRAARSTFNTVNLVSGASLNNATGFFMTGKGPYFVNPNAIAPTGRGVAPDGSAPYSGEVFANPDPGGIGAVQRRMFTGPNFFDWDAQLIKSVPITEKIRVDIQAAFFNFTNHAQFSVGKDGDTSGASNNYNVNATNFGRITQTVNNPRLIQFGAYLRF